MSEFDKLSFDNIPVGDAPPSEPLVLPPSFHRTELLLPPLPKPTVPVEPRSATPTLKNLDVIVPAAEAKVPEPAAEAKVPEPAKAPVPGRMAWVPEALRQMVRPSKSKGVMAAGAASLAAGIAVANWMWPTPQPQPQPSAEPVVAKVEFVPPSEAMPAKAPMLDAPATVTPVTPLLPAVEPLPLPKLPMDTQVMRAGGETPPLPVLPAVTLPTAPATTPTAPPLAIAPPAAPAIAMPAATAPTIAPPVITPVPAATAPAVAPPPTMDLGVLPGVPKLEEKKPEPPKTVDLPKLDVPKMELPKVEVAAPPAIADLNKLPKVEAAPPAIPDLNTLPKVEIAPVAKPPVLPDAPKTLVPVTPPVAKDDFGPPGGVKPTPAPQTLPRIDAPPEPRPFTPPITATPTPVKTAAAPPREDFDVDVHYATANDTYASISKRHLEDDRYADALRAYNGNRALVTGQPVDVPPLHVLRKQYAQLIAGSKAVMPSAGEVIPASRSTGGLKSYDVPAGGTTFKALAKAALGDESLWGPIWELNPRLKADDVIPAGTRLRLPGDARLGE